MDDDDLAVLGALGKRVRAHELEAFLAQGEGCGWCRRPVRLRGYVGTGRGMAPGDNRSTPFTSLALPDGVVLKACGSRREGQCPACARVYRADARHLVRAGLAGGKGVDASVASHPAVLLTLTATSFGAVHAARPDDGPCRPWDGGSRCPHGRPRTCALRHHRDDSVLGAPLCPDCYDYEGAVLHNACTPELWRRTTVYVPRLLARGLGTTQAELRRSLRLSFVRVAELQRRGVVHLHAVVRADVTDDTTPDLPAGALALACLRGARAVRVPHPRGLARWGAEVDAQILEPDGGRASRVAGYVAKYATKSASDTGVLDRPITSEEDLASRELPPHARRMVAAAWRLGADPELAALGLRRHAHSFGYGGHFLTKSRRYSTTFGALRRARAEWRAARPGGVPTPGEDAQARWWAVGIGWADRGEALFAEDRRRGRDEQARAADEDRYWSSAETT